jgi:Pyruvate/2-oxoacid:ferredoxin oxidoreductase delta subunit
MDKFLSPEFLQFFLPLFGGVIAWFFNERRKRAWEEYQKKEERYRELLRTIKGFYIETADKKMKDEFLEQLKQCWLYCPDEVIKKAYSFLNSIDTSSKATKPEQDLALGNFVAAIRNDLLSRKITRRSDLNGSDFKHLRAT